MRVIAGMKIFTEDPRHLGWNASFPARVMARLKIR
jgi:hypothetical protein